MISTSYSIQLLLFLFVVIANATPVALDGVGLGGSMVLSRLFPRADTPAATERTAGIAGGTVGAVGVLIAIGIFVFAKRARRKRELRENEQQPDDPSFTQRDTILLPSESEVALRLSTDWNMTSRGSSGMQSPMRKTSLRGRADSMMGSRETSPLRRGPSAKNSLESIPEAKSESAADSTLLTSENSKEPRVSVQSQGPPNLPELRLSSTRDSMAILPATPRESITAFAKKTPQGSPPASTVRPEAARQSIQPPPASPGEHPALANSKTSQSDRQLTSRPEASP